MSSEQRRERMAFANELVPPILNEEKTATVRYDDFEGVRVGDTITATTTSDSRVADLKIRRTATVSAVEAHSIMRVLGASYPSECPQDVIDSLNEHYDDGISPGTTVRVLVFEVVYDSQ